MYVLELAVQGAIGFSPTGRFPLKPGYTVLKPPAGSQVPLSGLSLALLFADGRGGDAAFATPGQKGKVGLTLLGNDQNTYRLLRELGGSGGLTRLNRESQAFEVVSRDAAEIQQFLRAQVGLPTKSAYEQIYCFSLAQLPSRRSRPKAVTATSTTGFGAPALASARPVEAASDIAAAEAKLAELEREHGFTQEVDQLQFRADGIAQQVFELESQTRGTEGLRAALAEAEIAWTHAPTPATYGLAPDIVERAQTLPELMARRDRELAKLRGDSPGEVEPELPGSPRVPFVPPVWQDPRFQGAVGAGVALFLAAIFAPGYWKYVGLLDIPAFGFGALLALQWINEKQDAERASRKGGMAATRERKILADYDAEAGPVLAAMKQLGVENAEALSEHFAQKGYLAAKVEELRRQLDEYERAPESSGLREQLEALRAEQEQLNAEIAEKGAYVRDLREIEREIARTRESIELARSGAQPGSAPVAAAPAGELLEDPCPGLLNLAADLLTTDVPSAATLIKDRAVQYLSALTDRRCTGLELDREGRGQVATAGGMVPAGVLPPVDLDLLFLAIKLTVIEKVSARSKLPVLIDDGLSGLAEAKVPLMARMLKHVGTLTQVLHATALPAYAQAADAQVNV